MTRPRPHSWARARTKPQVLWILGLALMEGGLGLFRKVSSKQAEGQLPGSTDSRHHRSLQEQGATLEGSCEKELHEQSKVEASLRKKQEQVRKRGTEGSSRFVRLPSTRSPFCSWTRCQGSGKL